MATRVPVVNFIFVACHALLAGFILPQHPPSGVAMVFATTCLVGVVVVAPDVSFTEFLYLRTWKTVWRDLRSVLRERWGKTDYAPRHKA